MIITGDISKKENDSTFYINRARFTTSQKENPDYYVQTNNIKIVPDSKIVGGMSNLVIADVPTPCFCLSFILRLPAERLRDLSSPPGDRTITRDIFYRTGDIILP